ncbi:uncharacterized protein BCR38DRAFT_136644 [Pseudomassariella vexata]|uniref:Uncharacterized protein n=1 Tax=Pseudomassariella vexata TaxID=1141098 RepID=A0A1Y2EAU1_9PEZI|nr:uncharacterized protein BCR38DRAFT_136644 [Pseudomassariella vexata]ORY68690.1 hypothetical protein BCR38DRAFT_136644 [Pseudomassariella vexata]
MKGNRPSHHATSHPERLIPRHGPSKAASAWSTAETLSHRLAGKRSNRDLLRCDAKKGRPPHLHKHAIVAYGIFVIGQDREAMPIASEILQAARDSTSTDRRRAVAHSGGRGRARGRMRRRGGGSKISRELRVTVSVEESESSCSEVQCRNREGTRRAVVSSDAARNGSTASGRAIREGTRRRILTK